MERNTTLWERAAALVLALFMVFSMMPLQAFALGELVTITGADTIAVEMDSITLTANVQNPPQGAEISYVWSVPDNSAATITAASDTNTATLTRVDDKNGKVNVTVTATYTNGATTETLTSQPYSVLVKRNADMTVSVSPESPTTVDTPLTATVGGTDKDAATLQWQKKNGESYEDISGATENTYTPDAPGEYQVVATVAGNDSAGLVGDSVTSASVTVKKNTIAENGISVLPNGTETLTYGDALSSSSVNFTVTAPVAGTMYFSKSPLAENPGEGTPNVVLTGSESPYTGTLSVANNTSLFDVSTAGDNKPLHYWFEPTESNKYDAKSGSFTYNVAKKTISISDISLRGSKTYDGTTDLSVGYSEGASIRATVELNDVVGNDVVQVSGGLDFTLDNKNVGTEKHVTVTGTPTLEGAAAENYEINIINRDATVDVVPAELTLNSLIFDAKTYDATAVIDESLVHPEWVGLVQGDDVYLQGYAYQVTKDVDGVDIDKTVGNNKPVAVTGVAALGGEDKYNYRLTIADGAITGKTINVNPVSITVNQREDPTVIEKISDGTNALTEENRNAIPDNYSMSGKLLNDDVSLAFDFQDATYSNIHTYLENTSINDVKATLTGEDAANYTLNPVNCGSVDQGVLTLDPIAAKVNSIAPNEDDKKIDLTTAAQKHLYGATFGTTVESTSLPGSYWLNGSAPIAITCENETVVYIKQRDSWSEGQQISDSGTQVIISQGGVEYGPYQVVFKRDTILPEIELVRVTKTDGTELPEGIIFDTEARYTVSVTDEESGIDRSTIQYVVSTSEPGDATHWTNAVVDDNDAFSVAVPAAGKLYVRVKDKVGNQKQDDFRTLVVERDAPNVTLTVDGQSVENGGAATAHKQDFTFGFQVTEPNTNQPSGIKEISYSIQQVDGENKRISTIPNAAPATIDDINNSNRYLTYATADEISVKSLFPDVQLDGDYQLTITATDFCGNSAQFEYTFKFDNTPATAAVTMSKTAPASDGEYYYKSGDAEIQIHLSDAYGSVADPLTYTVTVDGRNLADYTDKQVTSPSNRVTIAADELPLSAEVEHTIGLQVTDSAGNVSRYEDISFQGMKKSADTASASIIIDNTAPVVTLTVDGANKIEGVYYVNAGNCGITVAVTDDHAGVTGELAHYSVLVDSCANDNDVVSSDGTNRTMTIANTAVNQLFDGDKTITVTATDAAGNAATSMTVYNAAHPEANPMTAVVNLDTTAPKLVSVVSTSGNQYGDGIYYTFNEGDKIVVTYRVLDTNYYNVREYSSVTVKKNGELVATDVRFDYTDGQMTVTIPVTVNVARDVYSLEVYAQDKALNPMTLNLPVDTETKDQQTGVQGQPGRFAGNVDKIVDTVAPQAVIRFNDTDQASVSHNHYYEEDGQVRAYYSQNVGNITATYDVSDSENDIDYNKIWVAFTGSAHQNLGPGTMSLSVRDPGDYTFSIYGTDKAGNALTVIEKDKESDTDENSVVQNNSGVGYGTQDHVYTTYPKTLDKSAPTVNLSYTSLDAEHYNDKMAHYKGTFKATYTFEDDHGLDLSKIFTGYNYQLAASDGVSYEMTVTPACEMVKTDVVQPNTSGDYSKDYTITADTSNHSTDGNYNFKVYGEDKAGNPLTVTETGTNGQPVVSEDRNQEYTSAYIKVMDTRSPVAKLVVTTDANRQAIRPTNNNRFYLNKNFNAVYTVTELNFAQGYTHAKSGKNTTTDDYESGEVGDIQTENAVFASGNSMYTYTFTGGADGIYAFAMAGTDWAGNPIQLEGKPSQTLGNNPIADEDALQSYVIALDTTKPEANVMVNDYYSAHLYKDDTYVVSNNAPYRNERSAQLTINGLDKSPVQLRYTMDSTYPEQRYKRTETDTYTFGQTANVTFSGEQVFAITELVVADLAGNVSTAPANVDGNVSNYIYLDVTPPTEDKLAPTVSLVAHESGQGRSVQGVDLYNSTVTVEAKISDPGFGEGTHGTGGTSSGLFTLHYVVQHNDSENWNAQMEGKVATTSTNHGITTGADGIVYYTESKKGDEYTSIDPGVANEALVGEDTITFTFDAATFNYNDISIRVWAEDNTGHKSGEAIYRFGIDTTAPKIQVTYDNNDARNEKYFKADRTATVVVTERNFDPDNTVITTEVGHSGWSYAAGGLANGDDDTWTCTVPYTEDADYTFNVTAKDLVGHDAGEADYGDSVAPREFTVDKTKPVIEITFDNNDVRNGRYYKENRTATIHIEEHNFAAEDAEVTTTAEIAEGGVAAPAAGSWGSAGDSNTAQVPFNADGDYTMQVKFQDKAGNEAEPKEVELFTVDTTAPELTFSINDEAFEAGSYTPRAYNGQVVPGITYHDINYDGAGTQMSIVGAKNVNSQILSGAPAEDAMGGVYTCENIAETPENDDVYTCTGRVVDMAGNESTVDFLFSVNRYGSNYLLTPDTQALVDNYYTNRAPNLGVSEINVNTLKFEEITYALNGDIRTLQPGTDYQVTESGSETSWKQYDYTIFNSNFDREGVYDITIYSEDEAGNANSNHTERVKEYSKNISFVLDQTAPSITISGVDEGGIYDTDTRSVTVAYGENFAMDNLIITNGEKTETYTAEQLQATGGTLEFVVPASREKQSVKVTAADKAGNIATIESPRFVLSSSLFVRWVNNTPVMVGTISFGVLAVAAVADYLRKGFLFALLHKHTGVKH